MIGNDGLRDFERDIERWLETTQQRGVLAEEIKNVEWLRQQIRRWKHFLEADPSLFLLLAEKGMLGNVIKDRLGDVVGAFNSHSDLEYVRTPSSIENRDAVVRVWRGHEAPIAAIAISTRGDFLLSSDKAGEIRIWRIPDGTLLVRLDSWSSQTPIRATALRFWEQDWLAVLGDAEGSVIFQRGKGEITASRSVSFSDPDAHFGAIDALTIVADGLEVLSSGQDGRILRWQRSHQDADDWRPELADDLGPGPTVMQVEAQGSRIAIAVEDRVLLRTRDGDSANVRIVARYQGYPKTLTVDWRRGFGICRDSRSGLTWFSLEHDGPPSRSIRLEGVKLEWLRSLDSPLDRGLLGRDRDGDWVILDLEGDQLIERSWFGGRTAPARTEKETEQVGTSGWEFLCQSDGGLTATSVDPDNALRCWSFQTQGGVAKPKTCPSPRRPWTVNGSAAPVILECDSDPKTMTRWDSNESRLAFASGSDQPLQALALSNDAQLAAAGDDRGCVWLWTREGARHLLFPLDDYDDAEAEAENDYFSKPELKTKGPSAVSALQVATTRDGAIVWIGRENGEVSGRRWIADPSSGPVAARIVRAASPTSERVWFLKGPEDFGGGVVVGVGHRVEVHDLDSPSSETLRSKIVLPEYVLLHRRLAIDSQKRLVAAYARNGRIEMTRASPNASSSWRRFPLPDPSAYYWGDDVVTAVCPRGALIAAACPRQGLICCWRIDHESDDSHRHVLLGRHPLDLPIDDLAIHDPWIIVRDIWGGHHQFLLKLSIGD